MDNSIGDFYRSLSSNLIRREFWNGVAIAVESKTEEHSILYPYSTFILICFPHLFFICLSQVGSRNYTSSKKTCPLKISGMCPSLRELSNFRFNVSDNIIKWRFNDGIRWPKCRKLVSTRYWPSEEWAVVSPFMDFSIIVSSWMMSPFMHHLNFKIEEDPIHTFKCLSFGFDSSIKKSPHLWTSLRTLRT